jgi:hypothetical protein
MSRKQDDDDDAVFTKEFDKDIQEFADDIVVFRLANSVGRGFGSITKW